MKRLAGLSALALTVSTLGGCGWLWGEEGYFRDRGNDYLEARQSAPMQLPSGVQAKSLEPLLPVPQRVASLSAAQGDYEVPRPLPLATQAEVSEFSLQRSGDARWLVAQRIPAEVWPLARQLLEDNGLRIERERPQTGELVTAWQRFDELSSGLGQRLAGAVEPGREARVRVRIEPGVVRNTSEIFVVTAERSQGSSADVAFPERALNSSLDGVMLDELLGGFNRSLQQGSSVSLLASSRFDSPGKARRGSDGNGNPLLHLDTDFDRAWSSVSRALELSDLRVEDLNRSLGVFYVNLAERAVPTEEPGLFARLFGSAPSKEEIEARAERYQVRLTPSADSVQVSVEKDSNTVAPSEVARRLLSQIQENLG